MTQQSFLQIPFKIIRTLKITGYALLGNSKYGLKVDEMRFKICGLKSLR